MPCPYSDSGNSFTGNTMNPLRLVNYIWPALVSMMVLSTVVASLPAVLANDTPNTSVDDVQILEQPTGSLQDLEALDSKSLQQWPWDIDESDGIISENFEYEITPDSSNDLPSVSSNQADEDWENSNRGDPKETGGTMPLVEF